MNTKIRSLLSVIVVASLMLAGCAEKPVSLKILYWNIQNGMWSDQRNNYDNFVDFVASEDPDICVWAEAESRYRTDSAVKMAGCEEAYLPYNWDLLARRYGHQYVCIAGKHDTFPQVVTSKYPVKIVKRINGNGEDLIVVHGSGHVEVDVDGEILNIVTVHTYPFKYAYLADDKKASAAENGGDMYRAAEIRYICEQTVLKHDPDGKGNWMMLGDFNAVARADNWHLGRPEDDKAFLLNDYIRSHTPYVDVIERWYPGEYHKSTFSGRRIDFIYMTEPLFAKVIEARTIHDGFATSSRDPRNLNNFCNPSDHYPITVTLKLQH